jgi:hypothetical protein
MGTALLEGQVAELIDDEELGLGVEAEALGELALGLGLGERRQERSGAGEERGVAGLDGGPAERDGEVGLADAGRAEDEDVLRLGDVAAHRELPDELLVHRGLKLEVEVLEHLHGREVGDLDAHGDPLALLGPDLLAQDDVEEVHVGRLGASRVGEQGVELLGDAAQPEAVQVLEDAGADNLAHAAPSTTAA